MGASSSSPAPETELVDGPPDVPDLVTLRLPDGTTASFHMLKVLTETYVPDTDAHGKTTTTSAVIIPQALKLGLMRRFGPRVALLVRRVRESLQSRNPHVVELVASHREYLHSLKAHDLRAVFEYLDDHFSVWWDHESDFEFRLEGQRDLPVRRVKPRREKAKELKHFLRLVSQAPVVPGEFVLWRHDQRSRVGPVKTGEILPLGRGVLSASLMLPVALSKCCDSTCVLLQILVRFDQVPGLALMDHFEGSDESFEVALFPCSLRVEKRETLSPSELTNAAELRLYPFYANPRFPLSSVEVVTCRALPLPVHKSSEGGVASFSLLQLLTSSRIPEQDYLGEFVFPSEEDLYELSPAWKQRLVDTYRADLRRMMRDVRAALGCRNPRYLPLVREHARYVADLKASDAQVLSRHARHLNSAFSSGEYKGNTVSLRYSQPRKIELEGASPEEMKAWKEKGIPVSDPWQKGVLQLKKLFGVIARAPLVRGEFVLWRKDARYDLAHAEPGQSLPCPSFMSTTLMLPTATNWSETSCCLLKIMVNFEQVPALAILDQMKVTGLRLHTFEVLLHPCFLHVEQVEQVQVSDLLLSPESKIHHLFRDNFRENATPQSIRVITCRAQPGRMRYTSRHAQIVNNPHDS